MYEVFTKLLNMSLTASILVLLVIILRFALKKAPKKYVCILWALVAVRLILPFSISSSLSAYNVLQQDTISSGQVEYFEYNGKTEKPQLTFEVPALVNDNYSPDSMTIGTKQSGVYMPTVVYIWVFGVILMLGYAVASYVRLRKEVKASIKKDGNIYVCDEINSPFILGIISPRIYLPSGMSEEVSENVIAHEKAHIKRLDYLWKPLGFILLSIYWFNPVMWVSYVLLCKDIEAACDEKVISQMDKDGIACYSQSLLACAAKRRMITACPVAFGETDVKGRIKNVLSYKKPAFWIVCLSIIACIIVAVCFLTNPKEENINPEVTTGLYTGHSSDERPMFSTSSILINDDGTFSFSPSLVSSYLGLGSWEKDGKYIIFNDRGMGDNRKIVFQYTDGKLYYIANRSTENNMWGLTDGAEFSYQNETSLIEYLLDNRYTEEPDGVPLLEKNELSELEKREEEEKALASNITVSGYSEYTYDLIFNFGGRYFLSNDYIEPEHSEFTPTGWYALGGEGECIDPSYAEREKFVDGKLIEYTWLDNHSDNRKIMPFSVGDYSCCLYQYSFDLLTVPELEQYPDADPTSEYWIVFYTEGEGKPLYIKYYNCDYFTQEQAMESIVPGATIVFETSDNNANINMSYTDISKWDDLKFECWPLADGYLRDEWSEDAPCWQFVAPKGTEVYACINGTAISGFDSHSGYYVEIVSDDNPNLLMSYHHLENQFLSDTCHVSVGEKIGTVGQSGLATGPFLPIYICNNHTEHEGYHHGKLDNHERDGAQLMSGANSSSHHTDKHENHH